VSYDLLFAIKKGKHFDAKRVADQLRKRPHWAKQNESQWLYQNEETGVYGVLDVGSPGDDEEALPAGFAPAALAANLNYARPSFFGHEFLPEVAWLAAALDLWIIEEGWQLGLRMQGAIRPAKGRRECPSLRGVGRGQPVRDTGIRRCRPRHGLWKW